MKESLEILSKVNEFYNHSWDKLMWIIGIAFTAIGIIFPIVTNWIQNKNIKEQEKTLEKLIKSEIGAVKIELMDSIKKSNEEYLAERLVELQKEIDKKIACVEGKTFHSIASNMMVSQNYNEAFKASMTALGFYHQGEDNYNANRLLKFMKICLPFLTLADIERFKTVDNMDIEAMLEVIEKSGYKTNLYDAVNDVKQLIHNLKNKSN